MDLTGFAKASVVGIPLVFWIVGLTYWFKSFRRKDGITPTFQGNGLLLVSMANGLIWGGGYMITQQRPPNGDWWVQLVYWFAVVVYGGVMGLVASGLYEVARGFIEKTFGELFKGVVTGLTQEKQ